MTEAKIIKAVSITRDAYAPYGDLIAADDTMAFKPANFGRAKRYNFLADAKNLRPESAKLNSCIFRCSAWNESQLEMKILERHEFSTQMFMPMESGKYITIVALGGDRPRLDTIKAFVIEGPQGITYFPGTWHYPMTVLGKPIDMFCLVYENGEAGDCEVTTLPAPIIIQI